MFRRIVAPCLLAAALLLVLPVGIQAATPEAIDTLEQQIAAAATPEDKARLQCFKARNLAEQGNIEQAEQAYLQALVFSYQGWILNEFGYFLFKSGQYEKAYKVALKTLEQFPFLSQEAEKLRDMAKEKYQQEYYAQNPPTIIMDTTVDPHRKTRQDYIQRQPATLIRVPHSQTSSASSANRQKSAPAKSG